MEKINCTRCKVSLPSTHFEKKRNEEYFKQCTQCREKQRKYKEDKEDKCIRSQTYYENNKEKVLEKREQYREENKEKISRPYNCPCGTTVRFDDKSRHLNSRKHLSYEYYKDKTEEEKMLEIIKQDELKRERQREYMKKKREDPEFKKKEYEYQGQRQKKTHELLKQRYLEQERKNNSTKTDEDIFEHFDYLCKHPNLFLMENRMK
eukprot:Lithocolla_globosa_v1_NODE_1668_length_2409_cov_63.986406.p1 type:complete len:206 gc:universal NODE_1668_length_2409_cov_63.986406:464-1081(+)